MRERYWVQTIGSALIGLAVGGMAFVVTALTNAPLDPVDTRVVSVVFALSWVTIFIVPMSMYTYFTTHPIEEEAPVAHIESVKGTVKFDDECLEYDFVHAVRKHPEAQAKIYESIASWESPELIADDIRGELWITTLDAIPEPGIHRDLFGRYLQSLDWEEIATYYIEQYEHERGNGEA